MEYSQRVALYNSLFFYDRESGSLFWKVSKGTAKAGDVAGRPRKYKNSGRLNYETGINGKRIGNHRIIYEMLIGEIFDGNEIDHIDQDPSNNLLENLRQVSHSENMMNRSLSSNNTSGSVGLSWDKRRGKWSAQIWSGGKKTSKRFSSKEQAISFLSEMRATLGFHENHGKK